MSLRLTSEEELFIREMALVSGLNLGELILLALKRFKAEECFNRLAAAHAAVLRIREQLDKTPEPPPAQE